MSNNSFLKGTLILTLAAVVARLLGVVQRVPLQHIMGNDGMNLYSISYNIYNLLFTIATLGIPSALSKQVAGYNALGRYHEAFQTYRAARNFTLVGGVFMALLLYLAAPFYADWVLAPEAEKAIKAIAPTLLFFPVISIMRGYFQGQQIMHPTGISQINEQILRVVTAVVFPIVLLHIGYNKDVAVAGASFGAFTGSIAALAVMMYFYKKHRPDQKRKLATQRSYSILPLREIYGKLFRLSVPITLSALAVPLLYFIDSSTGLRLLTPVQERVNFTINSQSAIVAGQSLTLPAAPYLDHNVAMVPFDSVGKALGARISWNESRQMVHYVRGKTDVWLTLKKPVVVNGKNLGMFQPNKYKGSVPMVPQRFFTDQLQGYNQAMELNGILSGSAQSLAGLPIILATALSMSIIPVVSAAHSRRDRREVQRMSSLALRMSLLTGVPAALYLTVAAYPVNGFLFKNSSEIFTTASGIIAALCFGTIFQIMMMTSSGILQGLGRSHLPMLHVAIGVLIKWIGNYIFAPLFGIYGIILATTLCFVVVMVLNMRSINRYTKLSILGKKWRGFLVSCFAMVLVGWVIVEMGLRIRPSIPLPNFLFYGLESCIIALVSLSAYGIGLFWLNGIDIREIQYLPGVFQRVYHVLSRYRILPAFIEQQKSGLH
ncbi:oligosaccharide flippase family protein [Aneurinibacillus sp. Ricciae_BoGa-3]|uniref:oligosaccharide flippase family protein n=1 Tax=Aneurinibacillus sp. Ricciae_BoGa-3 TaxID=3022697 RepID=UPI0023412C2D|nr:oligosaccharide flippase family protein [Aneurinibacillus sp. Ricciae_BoGa-3]WCK53047.1 oligosaccharide flippase family protein [Aneurinibacillus sp. Ricciae_BoGa-3]